jgi:molybdopterin synthase sulfur carrier subunit
VIVFVLPGYLAELAGGRGRVELAGRYASVGEALAALAEARPALRDRIQDEQGNVRPHVNVFVGHESIRFTGNLATPLHTDDEIHVIPAVSGG